MTYKKVLLLTLVVFVSLISQRVWLQHTDY